MPSANHPRAQFVPLSPNFDLPALIRENESFDEVRRVPQAALQEYTVQSLEQLVYLHVVVEGRPLVLEGWGSYLPPWLFTATWLEQNLGREVQTVRDIPNGIDLQMTMGHYLRSMAQLANQFTLKNYKDEKRQRLYLKDIDCPDQWAKNLKEVLPEAFYYLNECVESRTGGDGAIREPNEFGQMRFGKGVAPAGDLMSSLPPDMRAMNMMCYIGHEGTYTPAHREMCASLGHNLMVECSDGHGDEKPGSSIWFMTESKEREMVSEYFLSVLGHDIEVEKHFAQLNAWRKAPFNVWATEQKPGDLILIPPLAPHQVWNRGTRTMKVAWNRTTVDTLELAIHEALPRARLVCRDEQYKNKAIIYYSLDKYFGLLSRDTVEPKMWMRPGSRVRQVMEDFRRLFYLYEEVLISELFSPKRPEKNVEFLPYDSNVTCSYCRCNIFNRFLTCKSCILTADTGEQDTYDICMECYAMGRSCACISNLEWVEQWKEEDLKENYALWRSVVLEFEGRTDQSPQPLEVERQKSGKKSVAHICQEQLAARPWHDITQPEVRELSPGESDVEPEVDDEGRLKKPYRKPSRRGRVKPTKNKTHNCHICCHHEWKWKLAQCSSCSMYYCYGTLWRAFDLMPQTVMENEKWECPKCLKICSCGKCRKDSKQKPYAPKGTLLGHDTKKVADYRSVESLVDFSKTNLGWLRPEHEDEPEETARMKRLREKAEQQKAIEHSIDTSYLEEGQDHSLINLEESHFDNMADIDPQLRDGAHASSPQNRNGNHETDKPSAHASISLGNQYQPYGSTDAHYDLDDDYPIGLLMLGEAAEYPSRLLAPVVPMVSGEDSYPEPSHDDQHRMMGIGYYQQQTNEMDIILYDSPKSDDDSNERPTINPADLLAPLAQFATVPKKRKRLNSEGIPVNDEDDVEFVASKRLKRPSKAKGAMAVKSDIIQPPEARPARRSIGKPKSYTEPPVEITLGSEDEATTAKSTNQGSKHGTADRDANDVELATKALSYFNNGNVIEDTATTPASNGKRRGRPRGSVKTNVAASPAPARPTPVVKHRKSAWLARKEAAEAGEEYESEASRPARGTRHSNRSPKRSKPDWQAVNTNSDDESEDEDRGRRIRNQKTHQSTASTSEEPQSYNGSLQPEEDASINNVADEIRDGSLFGGDIDDEGEQNEDDNGKSKSPESTIRVQSTRVTTEGQSVEEVVVKRRRGRPPKNAAAPPPVPATRKQVDLRSPSTSQSPPPPVEQPKRFLSLREKLALKGKKVKIVASKTKSPLRPSSAAPSAREASHTPTASVPLSVMLSPARETNDQRTTQASRTISEALPRQSATSIATPEFGPTSASTPRSELGSSFAGSLARQAAESRLDSPTSDASSSVPAVTAALRRPSLSPTEASIKTAPTVVRLDNEDEEPPVKKGPTVVRLTESEEDEAEEEEEEEEEAEVISDEDEESNSEGWSSSDDDIHAVKPAPKVTVPQVRPMSAGSSAATTPRKRGRPPLRG
ncbi:AT hook domain-containing protein [Rutstroemia sp. NJR-2017a WRK4]|nr:AT hook domain-containing protein [Rutstroemia sp. NJR-2017a WRK4]